MPAAIHRLSLALYFLPLLTLGWSEGAVARPAFPGALQGRPAGAPLPALEFETAQGRVSTEAWRGKWTWLYLGFVSCPDACPTALNVLAAEIRRLKAPEDVAVRFVSVDPARDTPRKLADYVRYFHPSFTGLTGSRADIDHLVASLGTRYQIFPTENPGGYYAAGHPNQVFLNDPAGRLAAVYDVRQLNGRLAADFNAMELSGRYTWNLDPRTALFGYFAPIDEPAFGSGLFQYRPSAAENQRVPLGLAVTDSAHALAGVAAVGARRDAHQLELSTFNARPGAIGADASLVTVAGVPEASFYLYARLRAPGF